MFPFNILVPETSPQNVECDNSTRKVLEFTWDPPESRFQNGIIISYDYQIGIDLDNPYDIEEGTVNDPIKRFDDLDDCQCYEYRVRARTSVGPGPYTDIIKACTVLVGM